MSLLFFCLSVTAEDNGVVLLPHSTNRGALLVVLVTFALETTSLLTGTSKATELTVLVSRGGDPLKASITTDGVVGGIHKDDLIVLVGTIMVNPVRVKHTEVSQGLTSLLLSDGAEGASVLQLVDSLTDRLTVDNTLGIWPEDEYRGPRIENAKLGEMKVLLATTTANTNAVNNNTLLVLVTKTAGLIDTGGAGQASKSMSLAVLPAANTLKEAHSIRLLLVPDFFKVFVSS